MKIGDKITCVDADGATTFLRQGFTYTVRRATSDGRAVELEEVVEHRLVNDPFEERRFHPRFSIERFVFACGCAPWRPACAGDDWHLSTCGIAPGPTSLRLI